MHRQQGRVQAVLAVLDGAAQGPAATTRGASSEEEEAQAKALIQRVDIHNVAT